MNLLFICTDEQRPDTMACYGNTQIDVPNLNRLADASVAIRSAYCTQPWCTPSRSSILTGLYPHATGCTSNHLPLRADVRTIAEMLPSDYLCGYFGKWHLGDEVAAQHGFTVWRSYQDHIRRILYSRPEYLDMLSGYHHFLVANGYEPTVEEMGARVFTNADMHGLPEPHTIAAYVANETVQFIEQNAGNRPWMAQAHFHEPHPPFESPYDDWHDPATIQRGPAFARIPDERAPYIIRTEAEHNRHARLNGCDLGTEAGWRGITARYWGLMKLVDNQLGRILGALERSGQSDNTIVIYTSDHGEMAGDHGLVGKHVQYEPSVRVPFLVRDPRIGSTHRMVEGRFSQIDLVPTMLDLLKVEIPDGLHGVSRAAALRGDTELTGDVFIQWEDTDLNFPGANTATDLFFTVRAAAPRRTVVTQDGWKLNLYEADDHELYHLPSDPHELNNVIEDPAHAERIRDLRERIVQCGRRVNDPFEVPAL